MRAVSLILLLAMTVFAGCAEAPLEETQESESADSGVDAAADGSPTGNATVEAGNQTLEEIVPQVMVLVDGNVTEAINGTYVVTEGATVTFDASNTTADSFGWTLGNDTAEGPVFETSFTQGNHTVLLTVIAEGAAGGTSFDIVAVNATVPEPVLVGSTEVSFSRAAETWANGCKSVEETYTFPAGTTTRYMHLELDPSWTGVALDIAYRLYVFDAAGTEVLKAARTSGSNNLVLDAPDIELGDGDHLIRGEICSTFSPQVSFKVFGSADHYA